jgi:hypothetical protein
MLQEYMLEDGDHDGEDKEARPVSCAFLIADAWPVPPLLCVGADLFWTLTPALCNRLQAGLCDVSAVTALAVFKDTHSSGLDAYVNTHACVKDAQGCTRPLLILADVWLLDNGRVRIKHVFTPEETRHLVNKGWVRPMSAAKTPAASATPARVRCYELMRRVPRQYKCVIVVKNNDGKRTVVCDPHCHAPTSAALDAHVLCSDDDDDATASTIHTCSFKHITERFVFSLSTATRGALHPCWIRALTLSQPRAWLYLVLPHEKCEEPDGVGCGAQYIACASPVPRHEVLRFLHAPPACFQLSGMDTLRSMPVVHRNGNRWWARRCKWSPGTMRAARAPPSPLPGVINRVSVSALVPASPEFSE